MVEKKDNPSNAELLKIATDIVMSEYVTKKNDIHEKWIVESLYLWQTQGVRMAYPELPSYPTEKDIIERAKALSEFLKDDTTNINTITINNTNTQNLKEEPKKESLIEKISRIFSFFIKSS